MKLVKKFVEAQLWKGLLREDSHEVTFELLAEFIGFGPHLLDEFLNLHII